MALSLSNFLFAFYLLLVGGLLNTVRAATVTYNWDIGWVNRNPDGQQERRVIGINGQWPIPLLNITKGDRVIVNLHNTLPDQGTSVHFHGLYQNGSSSMDGPVDVTQCNVPPGSTMTYNFTIDQPGTYWYHSHTRGQYPDGWRGQFLVHDPENPYNGQFDAEIPITLSDWYHDEMPGLIDFFMSYKNPTGAEPVPNSALMNDTQNLTVSVEPGKTYYFRLSNIGAFAGQYFWIEGHTMKIIEVDGVYTEPANADMIYITAAQRYGFLVTMKEDASKNFAMVGSMDQDLFDAVPAGLNPNVTGWLVYDDTKPNPQPAFVDEFKPFDDFTLKSEDGMELLTNPTKRIKLDMVMANLGTGANYAFFNDVTYTPPVVPTLYSVMDAGSKATDPTVYGDFTNSYVLEKGEVVDIILNNNDPGKHPFHLHGHDFQAIWRAEPNSGFYNPVNESNFPAVPMRRDVFMVKPNGNFVIRFKADNPGVWLFHCHIDWHIVSGLVATLIEDPLAIQKNLTIPQNHFDQCIKGDMPYKGNAAGNTQDVLNLDGQYKMPAPLPSGFTARGIVALVFSCVSAFLGMAFIAWYGAAPIGSAELSSAQNFIARTGGSSQ